MAVLAAAALILGVMGVNGIWTPHRAGSDTPIAMAEQEREGAAGRPATTVRLIACDELPDVPGKSVATAIVAFPPGAYTPRHRHPGSVTAYVLAETLRSQLLGGPIGTYSTGQG